MHPVAATILEWYGPSERRLPWRAAGTSPWGVYVSEVMAQQTSVSRVAVEWPLWMERWPTPSALAASPVADVLRMWGTLGYPRRALWLHAAATHMVNLHDGEVPNDEAALRALPGIGEYTAAAILAFAFGRRIPVLDVNVRRVHSRVFDGRGVPPSGITNAERAHHAEFLPDEPAIASRLSQAVMEFGSLVCSARDPRCEECPVQLLCEWRRSGSPPAKARKQAKFEGSDRQCRGAMMAVLRDSHDPVPLSKLEAVWSDALQRTRCLDSLVADGLVVPMPRKRFALPS